MHQKGWAFTSAGVGLLCWILTVSAFAQGGAPATQPTPAAGVPIVYRGQEIVRIYHGMGGTRTRRAGANRLRAARSIRSRAELRPDTRYRHEPGDCQRAGV